MNSAENDTRPVWLTREQRDAFDKAGFGWLVAAWDAAPADPAEAVARTLFSVMQMRYPGVSIVDPEASMKAFRAEASHIVRALGAPKATP